MKKLRFAPLFLSAGVALAAYMPGGFAQAPAEPKSPAPSPLPALKSQELNRETSALAGERGEVERREASAGDDSDRTKLRNQLNELIKRLNALPAPTIAPDKLPPKKQEIPEGGKAVDSLRLAMNLFRDNDIEAANRAFHQLDPAQYSREDRAFVRYMTACCLRKMNKLAEASALYREVADAQEDEFITSYAISQIKMIGLMQDLEIQLEQQRSRSKTR